MSRVSLSKGGSEDGTLHFYETATGKALPDAIAHVQYPTAGGSAAWNADGTGIYYTRFPRKGERPDADLNFYQQVYFHKLGTPDTEDTVFDRQRLSANRRDRSRRFARRQVHSGVRREWRWRRFCALPARARMRPAHGSRSHNSAIKSSARASGRDNALYLLSRNAAPRGKILRFRSRRPELAKRVEIVPTGEPVIQANCAHRTTPCIVGDLLGGPSQIRRFGLDGKGETIIPIPKISAVQGMARSGGRFSALSRPKLHRAAQPGSIVRGKKPSR